jgi:ribonuclease HII
MPDFFHEIRHGRGSGKAICGVDEAGRGPLAGPVVAAAALLPSDLPLSVRKKIRDSKKLTAAAREELWEPLTTLCRHAIAEASVGEIDTLNILWASMLAMQRAVTSLHAIIKIDLALIDGNRTPKLHCEAEAIIGGDDLSLSIAAASIIAKVHRDRLMRGLAKEFPCYGWERNAGYGTGEHMRAVQKFGVTLWHRTTFAPIRDAIKQSS